MGTKQRTTSSKGARMINITISDHANQRIKERIGIKSQRAKQEYVARAYYEGLRENECDGLSLKFILSRKKEGYENRDLVLYRDQLFVFEDERLVTVLPVDAAFHKTMNKIRCKHNKRIA